MKHLSAQPARYAITILLMGGLCLFYARGVLAANGINKVIMFQGKVTNSNGTNVNDGVYDFEFKLYNAAGGGSTLFTETWSNAALWTSTMSSAPGNGGTQLTYSTGTNESSIKVGQILWNTTKQESVIVTAVDTGANTVDISPTRQAWNTTDTVTNRIYVRDGVFRVALNSLNTDLSGVNFGTDNIFLGINFNSDGEMKPRVQYSAVPYAFNAEKVNGLTVTNTSDAPFSSTTTLKIGEGKTVSIANSLSFSGTDSTAFTLPTGSDTLVGLTATQSLTNKTIGSTGLVFNGATTDITSFTNEDLTFTPNGTGNLVLSSDFNSGVLIGSGNTAAPLSVRGGIGSNAGFIVDQLLSGDLLVASQGGTTRFVVTNAGGLQLTAGQGIDTLTSGSLLLGNNATTTGLTIGRSGGTISLPGFSNCTALETSSGALTCGTDDGGANYWTLNNGALYSGNQTVDFLVGGTATASARFAVLNINQGAPNTPVASISAIEATNRPGISLGGDGTIQSLNRGTLTIGGSTTGNILLDSGNDLVRFADATLQLTGTNPVLGSTGSNTLTLNSGSTGNVQFFSSSNTLSSGGNLTLAGTISLPNSNTITGVTSFARFANGVSVGGADTYNISTGTSNLNSLTLNGTLAVNQGGLAATRTSIDASGNILPGSSAGANIGSLTLPWNNVFANNFFATSGNGVAGFLQRNLGAIAPINITDDLLLGGTATNSAKFAFINNVGLGIPTASISAQGGSANSVYLTATGILATTNKQNLTLGDTTTTGNILLTPSGNVGIGVGITAPMASLHLAGQKNGARSAFIIDQLATGGGSDLFTASAAGQTRFVVNNAGVVSLVGGQTSDIDTLTGTTLRIGATTATTLTLGRSGQGISLPAFTTNNNSVLYTGASGAVGAATTTNTGNCLISNGSGAAPSWGACTGTADRFDVANGLIFNANQTLDFAFGGQSSNSAEFVITQSQTRATASISARTSFAGLSVNQFGSGDILTASAGGTTRFTVANTGAVDIETSAEGLTINSTGSTDIHKTTSNNNQIDTDFQRTANGTPATLTNVTSANGDLSLDSGTVSGDGTITTGSQPATAAALGAGAQSITRPDGKYVVIRGGGTTTMYIYDTLANSFTTSFRTLNGNAGAGALALPRSDGRYLVIHGGGLTTNSIVDPMENTAVGASVASNANNAGTNAFRRQNGRYLVINGGAGTTQLWDPSAAATAWTAGPAAASGTWGAGSLVIPRPDGSALIINGGATATTNLYNPWAGTGSIGTFSAGPVLPVNCEINGAGSVALQKADGRYIILSKASVSVEYDPVTNTMGPCQNVGPAAALADGAHAIRLQDRRFLIFRGSGTTAAYIYNPETNTYSTHATATSTQGAGLHSIQKADGTWQVMVGGSTTTNNYNTQLVMSGSYVSEDFNTTSLNINSTLLWTIGAESLFVGTSSATTNTPQSGVEFMVRTASSQGGLSSAIDIPIKRSGDLILAAGNAAWARVTINLTRPIPAPIYDDTRRVWIGNGMTNMIRDYQSPTVFDYTIDNSTVLRRNVFDFSNSQLNTDPTEASPSALTRVRPQSNGLVLPPGEVPGVTLAGVGSGFYAGKPGPHPTTLQATGEGTLVLARPGGLFAVIASGSANLSHYDSASSQFIAQTGAGNVPTAQTGAGAFALKLPNGKFLIVFGNATGTAQTTTNIYDPNAASGSRFVAGPTLSAGAGLGAQALQNTDGTYTIVHGGGATTSSLFNPFTDLTRGTATLPAGPTLTTAANCGAWAIPLQGQYQGKYRMFVGAAHHAVGVATTMVYDAVNKSFSAGTNLTTNHGCGSIVFQRQDGYWVSIAAGGGALGTSVNSTNIINPFTVGGNTAAQSSLAGPNLSAVAGRGAFVIPRPDGTFLIGHGQTVTVNQNSTSIYFPWGSTMGVGAPIGFMASATGPVLNDVAGSGAVTFQRPDGKWVIINGGTTVGSNIVNMYDAGWFADGQYLSGQMKVPQLTSTSALTWKKTVDDFISMEVRTAPSRVALLTEDYRDINPSDANMRVSAGDQWLQMQINFSRKFPTYDGVNTDVWTTGGAKNYLNVPVPTLLEYKITNDSDLLTLKSSGQNIFRVSGSGNIYAGQQGGFFTSGADLAERYSSTESLMPGEVVQIDPIDNKSVKKSTGQYHKDLLGVVSTEPGFVAGAYTENSYPIALVGRVPVKVSTENGEIRAGDVLTSASIKGYAMKATVAGRVIGRALEDRKVDEVCPKEAMGTLETTTCGTVMMFVNLVDYQGGSVAMVMDEAGARNDVTAEELGLQIASVSSDESGLESTGVFVSTPERVTQRQLNTLAFLKELRAKGNGNLSEIFTDKISAVHEIVTPQLIADTIIARKIKAESIEGMEFIYGIKNQESRIKSLESLFASSSAMISTKSASSSGVMSSEIKREIAFTESSKESVTLRNDPLLTLNSLSVDGLATVSADLRVKNNSLIEGILTVIDTITTKRLVVFDLATFFGDVLFKKDVTFEGKVTFEKDAAGYAVIKKGTQKIDVIFSKAYTNSPIVTASLDLDVYKDENGKDEDQEDSSERILKENYTYVIAKKSEKGFTIILNKKATEDIRFSWSAVQIPNEDKKDEGANDFSSLFFDTNAETTFSPE